MRCERLSILGFGLTLAAPCWPKPVTTTVEFEYLAPPGCPSESAAWQALSTYSLVEPTGASVEHSAVIRLEISANEAGYLGTVKVASSARVVERQVADHRCDTVLQALALIAAIALDRAHDDEGTTPQSKSATTNATLLALEVRTPKVWSVGFAAALRSDVAPVVLVTPGIYVLHRRNDFGMVGHYYGGLSFGQTQSLHFDSGVAQFAWATGRLAACPLGGRLSSFSYGSCGVAEVGWLVGRGTAAPAAKTDGGFWVAPGLGVVGSVGVGAFELGAFGGALVPIVRDRYYFAPDETIHRAARLGWLAEVHCGVRIGE